MEEKIESATEYYAFLLDNDDEFGDAHEFDGYEELIIDNAEGAVDIGELTDKQFDIFFKRCQKEFTMKMFKYAVRFIDKPSVPPHKKVEQRLLLDECKKLTADRQEVLNAVFRLANAVRKASGCENKNISGKQPATEEKQKQNNDKRKSCSHKEHEQKIFNYIAKFLTLCQQNQKINKAKLAKEYGLRPEAVTRKTSKYYALIKEAEDSVKRPNFLHDRDAVAEFFFEAKKKLGFED